VNPLKVDALHIENGSNGGPKQRHLTERNRCYLISNRFDGTFEEAISEDEEKIKKTFEEAISEDEEKIKKTFEEFNFTVKMNKEDLTAEGIRQSIRHITQRDFSGDQCLVLFLISHGTNQHPDNKKKGVYEKNGVYMYGCDGKVVDVHEEIVDKLQRIPTLVGVPKLIFANFCRGQKHSETVEQDDERVRAAGGMPKKRARKADTLVFYATTNDYVAWLEPQNSSKSGTFFTNAVCDEIKLLFRQNKFGDPVFHLNDLIMKVNHVLSQYYLTFDETDYIQMSEACSTLTENIYFYSKEQCR